MFGRKPTSEQMVAGAQQELEMLREQLLIFLRQKRQDAQRKMTQATGGGGSRMAGEEDLSWLEAVE